MAKRCSRSARPAEIALPIGHRGWKDIERIIDWLADNWDQPDEGIWETRGGRRDFTYGRAMSWVALDGAMRVARELGRPADLVRWAAARDAIYEQIMERGWNSDAKGVRPVPRHRRYGRIRSDDADYRFRRAE